MKLLYFSIEQTVTLYQGWRWHLEAVGVYLFFLSFPPTTPRYSTLTYIKLTKVANPHIEAAIKNLMHFRLINDNWWSQLWTIRPNFRSNWSISRLMIRQNRSLLHKPQPDHTVWSHLRPHRPCLACFQCIVVKDGRPLLSYFNSLEWLFSVNTSKWHLRRVFTWQRAFVFWKASWPAGASSWRWGCCEQGGWCLPGLTLLQVLLVVPRLFLFGYEFLHFPWA